MRVVRFHQPIEPGQRESESHGLKSGRLLKSAMNRSGRFIGASLRINLQQLRETSFIEVAHRTIPVWLNPFRVLLAQIVVNLGLQRGQRVVRVRPGNMRGDRFRSAEHGNFDNHFVEVVQIVVLKDV